MKTTLATSCALGFCLAAYCANVTLNWTEPNDKSITGYKVYQSLGTSGVFTPVATTPKGVPTFTFTNIAQGQYQWYIVSTNAFADATPSPIVGLTAVAPLPVTNVTLLITTGSP